MCDVQASAAAAWTIRRHTLSSRCSASAAILRQQQAHSIDTVDTTRCHNGMDDTEIQDDDRSMPTSILSRTDGDECSQAIHNL